MSIRERKFRIGDCNIENVCVCVNLHTVCKCVMYLGLGPPGQQGPAACQSEWPYLSQTFT